MVLKQQLAVVRRQKTCLEKRVRQLERNEALVISATNVIKWARRWAQAGTDWDAQQLKIAVKRLDGKK